MQRKSESNSVIGLTPEDGKAVDALIEFRALGPRLASPDALGTADLKSVDAVASIFDLLELSVAADPPDDLVRRTLGRIRQHQAVDPDVAKLHAQGRGVDTPIRLREILAVAAMLVIGASVILPMLAKTRSDAMRVACRANMATVSKAFAQYAADYAGMMPRGRIVPDSNWYHVGWTRYEWQPIKANSANLYLLVRGRYVEPDTLACPANEAAPRVMTADVRDWPTASAVSYSYQNQFAPTSIRLSDDPRMAILADKNPRFETSDGMTLTYRKSMPMALSSQTHGRFGQNVLSAGGGVLWLLYPRMANGDHIFVADGVEDYQGNETPSGRGDAFLVP